MIGPGNSAEYRIGNVPRRLGHDAYDEARERLIDHVRGREDVLAVYETGHVGAPGLSDLDFTVVVADAPGANLARHLEADSLPRAVVDRMNGGTLMIMCERDFADITLWDDVSARRIHGLEIALSELAGERLLNTEVARVVDWLPERCARCVQVLTSGRVPVQRTVGFLHSLCLTLSRLEKVFHIASEESRSFSQDVALLRRTWFDLGRPVAVDRLVGLVHRGLRVGIESLGLFASWCGENGKYKDLPERERVLSLGSSTRLTFVPVPDMAVDAALSGSRTDMPFVPTPAPFYAHFAAYAAESGPISERIAGHLDPGSDLEVADGIESALRGVLRDRIRHCNESSKFLARNGFTSGLYKFGWFHSPGPARNGPDPV